MILDTSFLLDLKDGDPNAFETAIALYDDDIVQRIALPSVWELQYGATFADSEDEIRTVRNLLLTYPLFEFDEATAKRGGELLAEADRAAGGDSGIDNEDALIAAVADQVTEPVLTRNETDFERLGVDVEQY